MFDISPATAFLDDFSSGLVSFLDAHFGVIACVVAASCVLVVVYRIIRLLTKSLSCFDRENTR